MVLEENLNYKFYLLEYILPLSMSNENISRLVLLRGILTITISVVRIYIKHGFSTEDMLFLALCLSYEGVRIAFSQNCPMLNRSYISAIYSPKMLILASALPFWINSLIIIQNEQRLSPERIFWVCLPFVIALTVQSVAESQIFILNRFKKPIIQTGIFSLTRNPEFLTEALIHLCFAILANDLIVWLIFIFVQLPIFYYGLHQKELSLQKIEEWKKYQAEIPQLLPNIFNNKIVNIGSYITLIYIVSRSMNSGVIHLLKTKAK